MNEHIFFLFSDLGLGGVQRKIVDINNYIGKSKKYSHIVPHIIVRYSSNFSFKKQISNSSVIIHQAPLFCGRRLGIFFMLYILMLSYKYKPRTFIIFLQYNLLHLFFIKCLYFKKIYKLILIQENILSLENRKEYTEKIYDSNHLKFLYTLPDVIISPTKYIKYDLIQNFHVKEEKILVIESWTTKKTLIKNKKTIDIVYCGRFAKQKRLDIAIKIIKKVKESLPMVNVFFIGEGKEEIKLKQIIEEAHLDKNIKILSSTHKIFNYFSRSKIFILTSEFEADTLVIIEAMTQEVIPVILKRLGVGERIESGKNGFIEENETAMINRIIYLLTHEEERKKISMMTRKSIIDNPWENVVEKYSSLF